MEMDDAAASAAPTTVECSDIYQVAQPSAQSSATAPTVLPRGKKEMTPEARAAESKKRAARRVVDKQNEKDRKAPEEKARQVEILQAVHARAMAEALAKQAAVHAITMLKSEVVTQFAAPIWVHSQLCVVGGQGLATPCFAGPVFDARAASLGSGPVAPRCSGGVRGAVHGGWWRVPACHRPQPHACCGRHFVWAQQGSTSTRRR
jgi:hypothetical protein